MFPESRFILGLFSPILGAFFGVCVYFTGDWHPSALIDKIGKFAAEDVLFTFIILCVVGFIAALVGLQRIQPLVRLLGGKAVGACLALILGAAAYIIYYCLV